MKKVYCKNCRYFELRYKKFCGYREKCYAPENIELKISYYGDYLVRKNTPDEINKNNDCKSYKRKWWKFLIREDKRKTLKGAQPKTKAGPKPNPRLISYIGPGAPKRKEKR